MKGSINKRNPLENWTNALEFQRIFSPYRFCSVKSKDGDHQCLAFLNSKREQMSQPDHTRNNNSRDSIHHFSILVFDRFTERQNIVLSGYSHSRRYRSVNTQGLSNHSIKIWKSIKFVHGRIICSNSKKFISKFSLCFNVLGQRKECPGRRRAI